MVTTGVVVIQSFGIGSTLTKRRAKAFSAMEPVSTSAASSGVVALLGGVVLGCFLLWLVSSRWKHFFDYSEER
jgi:O-antigen/teichoic acid export membrane protein